MAAADFPDPPVRLAGIARASAHRSCPHRWFVSLPFRLVLQASRGAVFQLASRFRFLALGSASSRPVFGLTPEHLVVLAAFDRPTTVHDAKALVAEAYGISGVQQLTDDLLGWDLLYVCDTQRGRAGGFGHIEAHLPMLADTARVEAYAAAIAAHASGRRVAEIGCGTGILSLLAAKAGAESVWAVEESDIAELAEEVFRANHVARDITLVRANSFDTAPPEPVDLLIHEIFGVDPFDEGVLASVNDARRRWLRPNGRILPCAITVRACGVGGPRWQVGLDQIQRIAAVSKKLGIDLRPVSRHAGDAPNRRLDPSDERPTQDELRTAAVELLRIDLQQETYLDADRTVHLPRTTSGQVGTVLVWFDIHLDETRTLSTSPFDTLTHWGWQVWDLPAPVLLDNSTGLDLRFSIHTTDGCPQLELLSARAASAGD